MEDEELFTSLFKLMLAKTTFDYQGLAAYYVSPVELSARRALMAFKVITGRDYRDKDAETVISESFVSEKI